MGLHAICEFCFFFKPPAFFLCDVLSNLFLETPPQLLLETEHFASVSSKLEKKFLRKKLNDPNYLKNLNVLTFSCNFCEVFELFCDLDWRYHSTPTEPGVQWALFKTYLQLLVRKVPPNDCKETDKKFQFLTFELFFLQNYKNLVG